MSDWQKYLDQLRELFQRSKLFAYAVCGLCLVVVIAFPKFSLWIISTTVVFIFVKGLILIIQMINNK